MDKDPVCGMNLIPTEAAGEQEYRGETYYFCSLGCVEKFRANPSRYRQPKETAPPKDAAAKPDGHFEYTCPMHPEIRQPNPGDCPKCGMALEPAGAPRPATKTDYVCPMHPEVIQDHPGNCPKCGMALG